MRNLRNRDGFTLIELMIVVVIIGILAAIAIPKFSAVSNNAKQAEAEPILKQICSLAESYQQKEGKNAAHLDSLIALGWAVPTAKYFGTWTYTPAATTANIGNASATKNATTAAALKNPSMNCDNRVLTLT